DVDPGPATGESLLEVPGLYRWSVQGDPHDPFLGWEWSPGSWRLGRRSAKEIVLFRLRRLNRSTRSMITPTSKLAWTNQSDCQRNLSGRNVQSEFSAFKTHLLFTSNR